MISNSDREAFVWIWLPNEVEPVVAGRLALDDQMRVQFNYGRSYLERIHSAPRAISIYEPELPLREGRLPLAAELSMPGCIRDASPDAWGRRVILNKILGRKGANADTAELHEITYLLESGSDRSGALDFQRSPTEYVSRTNTGISLEELLESAARIEQGIALTPELDHALLHGTSIGGARPKALLEETGKKYVAKFSASTDLYNVVKLEFIAMRLAKLAGIDVAPVRLVKAAGKDVLLIERFDRLKTQRGWTRQAMVSALTLFSLDEMLTRYASYETLAEVIRYRFSQPRDTLHELFARIVFNILCGNTDDHAKNHAAFWNGKNLTLTPAYDICPQARSGREASQAMLIYGNDRSSKLHTCLAASNHFQLTQAEAQSIIERQITVIEDRWDEVCLEASLADSEKNFFWHRQFLNPFVFENT
jgi:serine/threonine-protein kinase HipA